MTVIKESDFINSVKNSLQFISYYHPLDFIQAMDKAYQAEKNPAAKDGIHLAIVSILIEKSFNIFLSGS